MTYGECCLQWDILELLFLSVEGDFRVRVFDRQWDIFKRFRDGVVVVVVVVHVSVQKTFGHFDFLVVVVVVALAAAAVCWPWNARCKTPESIP